MTDLQGSIILLHGQPKVGKTQLAVSFPSPLVISAEPGHKYVTCEVHHLTYSHKGWTEFEKWLATDHLKDEKTLIIDPIDTLYQFCLKAVCKANNWSSPQDAPFRGWQTVKDVFNSAIRRLLTLTVPKNITLMFIAHSTVQEVNLVSIQYHKVCCDLPAIVASSVPAICDHIWYLGYELTQGEDALEYHSDTRVLTIAGTDTIQAGTRDPSITVAQIEGIPKTNQYQYINDFLRRQAQEAV